MRIEEPAQSFDHRLLLIGYPTLAHHLLQAFSKAVRTFDAKCLHASIIGEQIGASTATQSHSIPDKAVYFNKCRLAMLMPLMIVPTMPTNP